MSLENPAPRLPPTRSERTIVACFALVLGGLFAAELASQYNPQKLSVLFVIAFWVPLLVLHEVGHAVAARLVGWHVPEMVIGFGRELFRFHVGQTRVRVRILPVEGYVVPHPDQVQGARFKSAFIYLAGPGSELLLIALLYWVYGPDLLVRSHDYTRIALQSLALSAALGAGFNLIPYRSGNGVSDGLGAFLSLFSSDANFALRLPAHSVAQARGALYLEQWAEALRSLELGLLRHPNDPQLLGLKAVALAGSGEQQAGIELLESLGHPNDQPHDLRHELLLDAAWLVLVSRDSSLLSEAERACERALEGWQDSVRGNLLLGHVLLERGQAERALPPLLNAYRRAADQQEEQPLLALLALAASAQHQQDFAQRFFSALDLSQLGPQLRRRVEASNGARNAPQQ